MPNVPQGARQAADVEQVRDRPMVEPHTCFPAGGKAFRSKPQKLHDHFVLSERVLDERAALWAAAAPISTMSSTSQPIWSGDSRASP
jgi:hypothetical protein